MGKAGNGYIYAGGDFQRTYPMTGVLRWNPDTGDLQVFYNGWRSISSGGNGGIKYNAGEGITISNDIISIDTTIVALKTELFSGSYEDLTDKPNIPTDYTAFEVFAHDYDIPVGECEELGGYVSNLIPASMTHNFVLRTMCQDYTQSDVVIDWGDGTTSTIAKGEYNKDPENADVSADTANGEANYAFSHTYAENGKYIVKIYGKQYYNVNNQIQTASGYDNIKSSLICRIFDYDLPLALHLNNLSSTCAHSPALLYVNAANIKYRYFINASSIFAECKNLLEAVEFKRNFINANCSSAHSGNISLRKTDMQIPFKSLYPGAAHQQYMNCWNLEVDIASLFPEVQGLVNCNFSFYRTFYECKKLYGTVPAEKLWNNKYLNVQAEPTSQTFKDCPAEILAQVPKEWGGTATEDYGNFVTGEQSAVLCGEGNRVHSDYSFAAGFMNTISAGDPENKNTKCFAIGGGNTIDGSGVITVGYNNQAAKYADGTEGGIAIGGGNSLAGQDNLLIGIANRNNTGINIIAIGTGIKNVTGNRSITIGSNITNKQEQGIVIGDSVETNSLDCRGAVFVNGHRFRKMRLDELDSTEMVDCFRHEYKGTSKPVMQEIAISGTTAVTLDIDQYSRFMLKGNGTADIEAVNMQNGDGFELFVNTSETSLILDSDIVGGDAVYDAVPGPHLIKFMYVYDTIYCKIEF